MGFTTVRPENHLDPTLGERSVMAAGPVISLMSYFETRVDNPLLKVIGIAGGCAVTGLGMFLQQRREVAFQQQVDTGVFTTGPTPVNPL